MWVADGRRGQITMPFYPIKHQHLHPIPKPPDRDPDYIKQEQERNLRRIWGNRFYEGVEALINEMPKV